MTDALKNSPDVSDQVDVSAVPGATHASDTPEAAGAPSACETAGIPSRSGSPKLSRRRRPSRRAFLRVTALILALGGVGTMLYPTWTTHQWVGAMHGEVSAWQQRSAQHTPDERDLLIAAMREHNKGLARTSQAGLKDPFSYEQPGFDLLPYGIEDDVVARIRIPRLDLDAPVVLGGSAENLARGTALLGQTSLPVGGKNTNVVIAGHRTPGMLWDVEQLSMGDTIEVTNVRDTLTYRIVETEIITPDAIDRVLIQPGRDLVTLVTCHPLRRNYQRYVVRAERVEEPPTPTPTPTPTPR